MLKKRADISAILSSQVMVYAIVKRAIFELWLREWMFQNAFHALKIQDTVAFDDSLHLLYTKNKWLK